MATSAPAFLLRRPASRLALAALYGPASLLLTVQGVLVSSHLLSALSIATASSGVTYLYVANGGYPGDAGDYQGHITAINLATGAQKVFNAACSDQTIHFVENGSPDST